MHEPRALHALVCEQDPLSRSSVDALLAEAGFEIVGYAGTAIEAVDMSGLLRPTLVVIAEDQIGMSGFSVIPELRLGDDPPEVLLIARDDAMRTAAIEAGAFELAPANDSVVFERLLTEVKELLLTGERRSTRDRRSGRDRRNEQDWSKVISERRADADRRDGLRREKDVSSTAKEILTKQQTRNSD